MYSRWAHAHRVHTYTTNIYIYVWPHRSQADTQSTHSNTDSTNSLILLPSLAEENGGPRVRTYVYVYVHMYKVDLSSN